MALEVTQKTLNSLQAVNIEPQIVLEIEGLSEVFGSRIISTKIKIGDAGLLIGDDWVIGGVREAANQSPFVSLDGRTTTSIRQQLQQDKGIGSSISSMQIALVDVNGEATKLASPGVKIPDVLGARCKVYLGFKEVSFPDDYVILFRGVVDTIDAKAGSIVLSISHPDQKKRQQILPKAKVNAIGSFDLSVTTTNGSTTATTADTQLILKDMGITGSGIQAGTVVASITNGTTFEMSLPANSTATATRTFVGFSTTNAGLVVGNANAFEYQNHAAANEAGLNTYLRLDDEFMELYQRVDSTAAWLIERGALGSTIAKHLNQEAEVYYRLKGNVIDLALQLMLSKDPTESSYGAYVEDVPVGSFVYISPTESKANSIWFPEVDLVKQYAIRKGDFVNITGASESDNLVGNNAEIVDIDVRFNGTLVTLDSDDVDFVEEIGTSAECFFTSKYNVLNFGLGMKNDEVDIDEHERIKRLFLTSFDVEVMMRDSENAKEFIERELYAPAGAYSLPRKGQASIGMHIGPIPGVRTKLLNSSNIKRPSEINVRRSIAQNFANTIIYRFDFDFLNDRFLGGIISRDETSVGRIKIGTRALVFESRGMRSSLNGATLANTAANRRLERYKFGAEYIENLKVNFKTGFDIEIGDLVLLDSVDLNIINSEAGNRSARTRYFEVTNKVIDIRTGEIVLNLVDTTFEAANRYGLISPASRIKTGISESEVIIKPSFNTDLTGVNEYLKWDRFVTDKETIKVRVRSVDGEDIGEAFIQSITSNTIKLASDLGFVPSENDIMELAPYNEASELIKLLYAFMADDDFDDEKPQYLMS